MSITSAPSATTATPTTSPSPEEAPGGGSPRRGTVTGRWTSAVERRRLSVLLAFPVLATVGLLVLVGLGWNGSSSGLIRQPMEGSSADPGHVFGRPNLLRSDEWLVSTPIVMAQDGFDYPQVNDSLLGGVDVSVTSAVPYRDWSTVFRPQYWAFFVLPFQQAFAFYWWFPAWLLAMGCYAVVLGLCPRRPLMAVAAAVAMCFAPFVQWWYLIITLGSLGWAAVILAAYVLLQRVRSRAATAAVLALIAYATAAHMLVLYPAFQIATAWVVAAAVVGWTFRAGAVPALSQRLRRLGLAAGAAVVGAGAFGLFALTRWEVIQAQADSEYPGGRLIPSGSGNSVALLSGFLDANLVPTSSYPYPLGSNSSEMSSFVFVGLFLVPVAGWLLMRSWRRQRVVDGLLVALLAVLALFLVFLFVPDLELLARLTLLSQVAPGRLQIGLGLLSLVLTAAVIREMDRQQVRLPWLGVAAVGLLTLALHLRTGRLAEQLAPHLTGSTLRWLALALVVTGIVVLAARGYGAAALGALAVFSVVATFRVNPVRDGVYDTRDTEVGRAVAELDREDPGGWIAMGVPATLAMLSQQPVERYTGTAFHPNLETWQDLDPTGAMKSVYNRYAIVSFTTDPEAPVLASPTPDQLVVRFDSCGPFVQRHIRHVVTDTPIMGECLVPDRTVEMPTRTYHFYEIL
jgi:hypothetical protein